MQFLFDHWQAIAALISTLIAIVAAVREQQFARLIPLAGIITKQTAELAGMDNASRREEAANALYHAVNPLVRNLSTREQYIQAVELAWHTIAKPEIKAEGQ